MAAIAELVVAGDAFDAVDEQTAYTPPRHVVDELVHQRIDECFIGPFPNDVERIRVAKLCQSQADAVALMDDSFRAVMETKVQRALVMPRAVRKEVKSEQRLAGSGGSDQRCRGPARYPTG